MHMYFGFQEISLYVSDIHLDDLQYTIFLPFGESHNYQINIIPIV